MALACSDDSVFDFPPLVQSMRLNIEGAPMYPMYRGGRVGRAAAAYYREKEVMIAIKNKYGCRFGRRIQAYKPDTEAWRPERYQKHTDTLNSQCVPKIIPGGLQNKKPLIHIHHHCLVQKPSRADQQERFSQESNFCDKYPPGKGKSGEVPVKTIRTSDTLDLAEPGRPSLQGRARMRGKRVVDISTIICAGDKEFTVESLINPEKREPEISIQKDKGNIRNCGGDQLSLELITSVENLSTL